MEENKNQTLVQLAKKDVNYLSGETEKIDLNKTDANNIDFFNDAETGTSTFDKLSHSVKDDINTYYDYKSNKMKADLFQRVYENEQQAFFQDHKRFMNSKEKKICKKELIKMIEKDLLYVNDLGQIKTRKTNLTPSSKKSKKRKK